MSEQVGNQNVGFLITWLVTFPIQMNHNDASLSSLDVTAGESLDSEGKNRFFCLNPENHAFGGYPEWYFKYDAHGAKSVKMSVCLSVCLYVCLSVYLSVCLSVCLRGFSQNSR